ncbi:MAG: DUF255 domain-containing protein [Alphaproteobacteria bacterium]|nr:DUF255 domain-containing protein [Alphaproteobacteria bacterium]
MRNELDSETSPYLLSHARNPVHWMAWGEAALERARKENKPVLLSVGYAACHWCHVMAHESFEDPETARAMNENFVSIKVDREERPDIDTIYQSALALLGEHGGWPLTMFLTPDGTPFWGGTYFPPEARYGRPGFRTLLARVAEVYRQEHDKVTQNAEAMRAALGRMSDATPGNLIPAAIADQVAQRLLGEFDSTNGGIGAAPKFPHVPVFDLVFRAGLRTGNPAFAEAVVFALRKMSQGGIYDHLRGGYARYSTDTRWLVPHFEKMLYDNAQLLGALQLALNATGDPLFAARITETADWVLAEMIAEGGGLAATLDADSEGEEGRFYVWTEAEVDQVLGTDDDARLFKKFYDVTATGNWEGKCILNRIDHPETLDPETETRLAVARKRLLAARAPRVRPGWDDKVLADWNGLMIVALARAGAAFERADWTAAALAAFDFVRTRMAVPGTDSARLVHSYRAGRQGGPATLDDYAAMINAALVLHEVTGDDGLLESATSWIATLDRYYADDTNGGYFLTASDASDLIVRTRNAHDGATPSGNGLMVMAFARLFATTAEDRWRQRAEWAIRAFSGELERNVFPLATLINAADFLARAVQVVIVGRRGEAATDALIVAAHHAAQPNLVLQVVAPGAELPKGHPAQGKTQAGGTATAYVCARQVCSLPFTDATELTNAIARA